MPVKTRWGVVFVLILAGVVSALQIGKAAIAVPILQRELALTLVAASWIVGAYGLLGAIAGLPAGILSSLLSARATLIAGLAVAGVGSVGGAFAESGAVLIATRVLEGCGSLAASLAIPRLLRAVTAPKDLPPVLAVFAAHLPFGSVVMMLLGPHAIWFGWQGLWLINGAIVLGYAVLIARHAVRRAAGRACRTVGAEQCRRGIRHAGTGSAGARVRHLHVPVPGAVRACLPALLVDRMGLSIAAAGTVSAIAVAANAVGNMSAGALVRLGVPLWSIMATAFAFVGFADARHFLGRGAGGAGHGAGGGEPRAHRPDPGIDLCGRADASRRRRRCSRLHWA